MTLRMALITFLSTLMKIPAFPSKWQRETMLSPDTSEQSWYRNHYNDGGEVQELDLLHEHNLEMPKKSRSGEKRTSGPT